jgi:hypothetical protein
MVTTRQGDRQSDLSRSARPRGLTLTSTRHGEEEAIAIRAACDIIGSAPHASHQPVVQDAPRVEPCAGGLRRSRRAARVRDERRRARASFRPTRGQRRMAGHAAYRARRSVPGAAEPRRARRPSREGIQPGRALDERGRVRRLDGEAPYIARPPGEGQDIPHAAPEATMRRRPAPPRCPNRARSSEAAPHDSRPMPANPSIRISVTAALPVPGCHAPRPSPRRARSGPPTSPRPPAMRRARAGPASPAPASRAGP